MSYCPLLEFLQQVFCQEHRTYRAHTCPKSKRNNRMAVICEICSLSTEKIAGGGSRQRHLWDMKIQGIAIPLRTKTETPPLRAANNSSHSPTRAPAWSTDSHLIMPANHIWRAPRIIPFSWQQKGELIAETQSKRCPLLHHLLEPVNSSRSIHLLLVSFFDMLVFSLLLQMIESEYWIRDDCRRSMNSY